MFDMLFILIVLITIIQQAISQSLPGSASFHLTRTESDTIDSLTINIGSYTELYIQLTPPTKAEDDLPRYKGKLTIQGDTIIRLADEYQIDSYIDMRLRVYIGVSCMTLIDSVPSSIQFSIEGNESPITIPNLNIRVTNEITKLSIEPSIMFSMPSPSYGYYSLKGEVYNTDTITISFSVDPDANVETMIISPFLPNRNLNHLKKKYYVTKNIQKDFVFTMKNSKNCYSISPETFSFQTTTQNPVLISEEIKQTTQFTLVKPSSIIKEPMIELTISTKSAPLIASCGSFPSSDYIPSNDEEIRHPTKASPYARYDQIIISSPNSPHTLIFREVSRVSKGYIIRCILEGTAIGETNYIPIEVRKKGGDFVLDIHLAYPSPSQCGTWSFSSDSFEIDLFTTKAKEYCQRKIASTNYNATILYSEDNGCIQCDTITYTQAPSNRSICMRSLNNCKTDLNKIGDNAIDIKDFFSKFVESIDSNLKIQSKFGLTKVPRAKVVSTSDDDFLDRYVVSFDYSNKEETEMQTMKITNKLNRDISCSTYSIVNFTINKDFTRKYEADIKLGILKPDKSVSTNIKVERRYRNEFVRIFILCKHFEFYSEGQYREHPILLFSLYDSESKIVEFKTNNTQNDCNNHQRYFPECLYNKKIDLLKVTVVQLPQISELQQDIQATTLASVNAIIISEFRKLESSVTKSDVINQIIHLGRITYAVNCTEYNNYIECRKMKINIIKDMLKRTTKDFPCLNIDETIKQINPMSIKESVAYFALGISYMVSNGDSFDMENSQLLSNLYHCFTLHLPSLIKQIVIEDKEGSKQAITDILNVLIAYMSYSMLINKHLEGEKSLSMSNYGVIQDQHIIQNKLDFEVILTQYSKLNIPEYVLDDVILYFHKRSDTQKSIFVDIINNVPNNITIPMSCLKELNADTIGLVVYLQYPLVGPVTSWNFLHIYAYSVRFFKDGEDKDITVTKSCNDPVKLNFIVKEREIDVLRPPEYYKLFKFEKEYKGFDFISLQSPAISNNNGTVTLDKEGDYMIGVNDGSIPWMIVMFVVMTGIILVGFGYLIYNNVKLKYDAKKKIENLAIFIAKQ